MDRVLGYEPRGRGFESCRARHPCIKEVCFLRVTGLFYCPSKIACLKGKGQRAKGKKTVQNGENSRTGGGSEQRVSYSPLLRSPLRTCRTRQARRQNPGPRWLQALPARSCAPRRGFTEGWPRPCAADFARSLCPVGQGCPGAADPVRAGAADGNQGAPSATRTPRRHASGISAVTDG